jgi:hypothetical protein
LKTVVLFYAVLVGFCTSTPLDFIMCAAPLCVLMHWLHRPRDVDVFIFTPDDGELAELFIDHIIEYEDRYDNARVMLVNTKRLRDELDEDD